MTEKQSKTFRKTIQKLEHFLRVDNILTDADGIVQYKQIYR